MNKHPLSRLFSSKESDAPGGFRSRAFRAGSHSTLLSLLVIAAAVAATILVSRLPASVTKLDATESRLISLSAKTEQMVSAIEKDVTVYIVTKPDKTDDMLLELLNRYKDLSRHVHVEKVDPAVSPNFLSQYTDSTLVDNSLVVTSGKRYQYIGYADIYEYAASADGATQRRFIGESRITGAIDFVTTDTLPRAYQLTGHGETGFFSDMANAVKAENIDLYDLNLLTADAVPTDCKCLIVISPQSDISAEEKAKLEAYLLGGGKLLYISGYTGAALENFDALLANYGVRKANGLVVEGSGSHSLRGYAHYLLPDIATHIITSPLRINNYYVLMPVAEGLLVDSALRSGVSVQTLLSTSDQAYAKPAGFNMITYDREAGDQSGPFALGVAITEDVSVGQTQIVWLSSADMLFNSVDAMVSGGNSDLIVNAINWMCERENAIAIEGKTVQSTALIVPTSAAVGWSLVMIFVLPLLFIITGIVVTALRKRR